MVANRYLWLHVEPGAERAPAFKETPMKPLLAALLVTLVATAALAHPGGLDGKGCHHNRKSGGYHCHR